MKKLIEFPQVLKVKELLEEYSWKQKLVAVLLISTLIFLIVDYYDLHMVVGYGFFSKQFKPNPLEAIVAALLTLTLYSTMKTNKEAVRQTELTLRPYIRFSWDTSYAGENRRDQGITDSCIVVTNSGNGLMRSVNYKIKVDGKVVAVRDHSLIDAHHSTNLVYDDAKNKTGTSLGCRNDGDHKDKNNKIIRTSKITIEGYYRDVEGGQYKYGFESDFSEQSWFREKYRQERVKKS